MRFRGVALASLPLLAGVLWALRPAPLASQAPPPHSHPSPSGDPAASASSTPALSASSAAPTSSAAPCAPLLGEREAAPADPTSLLYYVNRWRSIPADFPLSAASPWTPCAGPLPRTDAPRGIDLLCLPPMYSYRTREALRGVAWESPADLEKTHDGEAVGLRGRIGFKPLIDAAGEAGHVIRIRSGFRAYANQVTVFHSWVQQERRRGYPLAEATRRASASSAQPGHSEHQLGTTADLVYCERGKPCYEGWDAAVMASSAPLRWVQQNAHRFGMVISYDQHTSQITQYVWEPWHVRFVGARVADALRRCNVPLEAFLNERYGAGPLPAYELP